SFSSFVTIRLPPTSTLFPYTTLFRSPNVPASIVLSPLFQQGTQLLEVRHQCIHFTYTLDRRLRRPDIVVGIRHTYAAQRAHFCRSEEHTSELQSRENLVCRLLLEKKK